MKAVLTFLLLFLTVILFAQEKKFQLEGKIVDAQNRPIPDAYIINYRNLDKNISLANGVFSAWVFPNDSLLIDHISYYRKVVSVHSLLLNPIIQLQTDTINIIEIDVSPNYKNDYERAQENLTFLKEMEVEHFPKIKPDETAVNQMITEHNKIFRAEAESVRLVQFSPSEQIGKIFNLFKKRKKRKNDK